MKKIFLIISVAILILCGCDNNSGNKNPITHIRGNEGRETIDVRDPIYFGNGVYYFGCIGTIFANSLSYFMQNQDSLVEVKAMTGNTTWGYGKDCGYFVVVGKK